MVWDCIHRCGAPALLDKILAARLVAGSSFLQSPTFSGTAGHRCKNNSKTPSLVADYANPSIKTLLSAVAFRASPIRPGEWAGNQTRNLRRESARLLRGDAGTSKVCKKMASSPLRKSPKGLAFSLLFWFRKLETGRIVNGPTRPESHNA